MARIPTARPVVRRISARGISLALSGPEPSYPVYQFSDVNKYERPRHNPFLGLTDPDGRITSDGDLRVTSDDDMRVL